MRNINKILISFFLTLPVFIFDIAAKEGLIIITFFLVIIQSIVCTVWFKENGGSLFKMYFSFSYVFFGIVPCLEYINDVIYWGGGEIYAITYALVNVMLFVVNFIFIIIYKIFSNKVIVFSGKRNLKSNPSHEFVNPNIFMAFLISISCFLIFYYINNGSIVSMVIRGGELKESIELERWASSIIGTVSRFTPFLIFLLIISDKKVNIITKMLLFFIALLCASPSGMARFMVGLLYIPLLLKIWPTLRYGNKLPVLIMGSLAIIFPFLDNFRRFTSILDLSFTPKYSYFFNGHFDSYQSLARVVQVDYVTYGYQILGTIFFFIPRQLWPTKPIGSGAEIANLLNYSFTNVSMNYYGEGYINFGYFGIIIFAIILAIIFSQLDRKFRHEVNEHRLLAYYVLLPFVYILMRGDLNVAISLLISFLVSYNIALWAVKKKVKI
jgi:hypothetical protein